MSPLGPQTNAERVCFGRGMQQWRASLKRPDMTEEDRVRGALEAYCRMAFALSLPAEALKAADIEQEVRFLLDRLADLENGWDDAEAYREFAGHVSPSIARLRRLLDPK